MSSIIRLAENSLINIVENAEWSHDGDGSSTDWNEVIEKSLYAFNLNKKTGFWNPDTGNVFILLK